jgi:hypothetical protein
MALGCSVEVSNPKNPDPVTPIVYNIIGDYQSITEVTTSLVDDTIDSSADIFKASPGAALLLTQHEKQLPPQSEDLQIVGEDKCVSAEDGSAIVTKNNKGDVADEVKRQQRQLSMKGSVENNYKIVLKGHNGKKVGCKEQGATPNIDWREPSQFALDVEVRKSSSKTIASNKTGEVLRSFQHAATGNRSITLLSSAAEGGMFMVRGSMLQKIDMDVGYNKANGQFQLFKLTQIAVESSPIVIQSKYNSLMQPVEKKIVSGTIQATLSDSSKIEISYADITLLPESGCVPVSGSITGKVYGSSDLLAAYRTFVLDFGAQDASGDTVIKFDDGAMQKVVLDECSLF